MDNNDNKLKNLNYIKERLEAISALELLTIESDKRISLNPNIKTALNEIYRYSELSDRIRSEVESDLINAIFVKIGMIKDSLLQYIKP